MKYSKNFERDYNFYLKNIKEFDFYGNGFPKFQAIFDINGKSAKEVFYKIDSEGKNIKCREPELLNQLLACKASVNFHIKLWSEGVADGTLPNIEIENEIEEDSVFYNWINGEFVNCISMKVFYNFPDWVIDAIYNNAHKKYKQLTEIQKPLYLFDNTYLSQSPESDVYNLKHSVFGQYKKK